MKHSTITQTRRGHRGGPARRIGRSLALVLPVVLVLSGTLAVTRVNWTGSPRSSVLAASDVSSAEVSSKTVSQAPQDQLRDRLMGELQDENPGVVLTHLQQAVNDHPSLAEHCSSIARALGQAAARIYGAAHAQSYARPVCDTSFASGILAAHG